MSNDVSQHILLEAIDRKLEILLSVVIAHGRPQDEQIEILRPRGLDWPTIGTLVGLKPDAARKRLDKKSSKHTKRNRNGEAPETETD